jgi:hypothetical protein
MASLRQMIFEDVTGQLVVVVVVVKDPCQVETLLCIHEQYMVMTQARDKYSVTLCSFSECLALCVVSCTPEVRAVR